MSHKKRNLWPLLPRPSPSHLKLSVCCYGRRPLISNSLSQTVAVIERVNATMAKNNLPDAVESDSEDETLQELFLRSRNLSGGHAADVNTDVHEEDLEGEQSSSPQKKQKKSRPTPSLDTADVRSIVSFYKDNATKADPSPSEEVLLIRMCEDLEKFTKDEWHPSKFAKRGTKCNCLSHAFCHLGVRMVCANYAMRHFKLDKLIQDQFFVEMY